MDTAETKAAPFFSGPVLSWAVLLFLVIIWGSTFAGLRIGVETIDPAWLVSGRLLGAALFALLWMIAAGFVNRAPRADARPSVPLSAIGIYAFVGTVATALPFFLYAMAAESTGSAVLAICNGATPFGTAILAHMMINDRLTKRRIAGVVIGFAGLAVLVLPEMQKGEGGSLFGITIAIVGALLYSVGNIATRMAPRISPVMSSFILVLSGGIVALIGAALTAPFPASPSTASLIALVLLALLPTGIAMILYVWLIQRSGPVFVSFTTYLSPLWATLVGVTLMGEPLYISMVGALALILTGVAIANAKLPARRRNQGAGIN